MLRRILIIVLVAVVIIAAFFAIRAFLNRDSGEADAPDGEQSVVVEDIGTSPEDGAVDEDSTTEETDTGDETTEASVGGEESEGSYPPPVVEGDGEVAPAEDGGEADSTEEGGEAAPAEDGDEVAPTEDGSDMGGDANSSDPDAGGGVPAEAGEADSSTDDADAVDSATGGLGDTPAISQPVAFVQPGVPTQHNVVNEEWLTQLARCYGTTVADIQAANNYACPDLIQPGWVVNISNPGNVGPITINEQPCFIYYTVQQGETLYSIAEKYGIHYQWLASINAIYNYNYIYAGDQLVIPNPVDTIFTQPPATPYFYSNCWYGNCPVYPVQPIYPVTIQPVAP